MKKNLLSQVRAKTAALNALVAVGALVATVGAPWKW